LANRKVDKGVARYYRLYELLLVGLRDGTIPADSALPSEPQLCLQHRLSRTTVRRALARLEHEGLIVRRRGSGTYARAQSPPPRLCLELHALPQALADLESRTTTTTLRFNPAAVPAALRALAAGIGSTAYLLERLRCSEGQPLSLTSAYLPESLGQRLRRPIPSRASVISLIHRLHPPTAALSLTLDAVPADAEAARVLEMPLGSPLLRVRAVLVDADGGLRAVLESLCRSDRLRLKMLERAG
jgi:GntR family transcriptional regulator